MPQNSDSAGVVYCAYIIFRASISTDLKTVKNTLKFFHDIFKMTLAQPQKTKHELR